MKVFPSKYVAETIMVRWNFIDIMPFGVVPISASVTVTLSSGTDPFPEELLVGSATVSGSIVTQQLTQGYAGDVYILTCAAVDVNGNVYVKTSLQAVIANTDSFYRPAPALALLGALMDGYVGYSYYDVLLIEGGTSPYSNPRTIAGTMPAWMSANIIDEWLVFTGNPNATGVSIFTPDITDFAGNHADNPQEIEVFATPPALEIVGDLPDGYVGGSWAGVTYTVIGGEPPYTFNSLVGTIWPGNLGPMNTSGVVSPEVPTTVGMGLNAVEVIDVNGLRGTKADPFTIGPAPGVMMAMPRASNFPIASLDGITWYQVAVDVNPATTQLEGIYPGRFISSLEYSDDIGATAWGVVTSSVQKNFEYDQSGDNVIWNSSGPFEVPAYSSDRGLTAAGGDATGNGVWWAMFQDGGVLGASKSGYFVTAPLNASTFTSTGVAHGMNTQNIGQFQARYSGGCVFAGFDATAGQPRVLFTADGLAYTGGNITNAGVYERVVKCPSGMCVGFIEGEEVVALIVTNIGDTARALCFSVIGSAWTIVEDPLGIGSAQIDSIAWNGVYFILSSTLATVGYMSYSTDLVNWNSCTFPADSQGFTCISAIPQEEP